MTRKKGAICVAAILLPAAIATIGAFEPTHILRGVLLREAFFRGRPTSYWRDKLKIEGDAGRIQAQTFEKFDDLDAVPVLRECALDPDPNVRWTSVVLIQRAGFIQDIEPLLRRALDDPDSDVRVQAIRGLARLQREALSAVPKLVEMAHDEDVDISMNAHYALWEIDEAHALSAGDWTQFASDDWQFAVMMPGAPEEETTLLDTPYGPAPCHKFVAMLNAMACIVGVTEYSPQVAIEFTAEERHDAAIAGLADALGGVLLRSDRIEQSGYSGRETLVEVKDTAIIHNRSFLIGNRSYQVSTSYPPKLANPKTAEYNLNSFRIDYAIDD